MPIIDHLRRNNGGANEFGIFGKLVEHNFAQLNSHILRDSGDEQDSYENWGRDFNQMNVCFLSARRSRHSHQGDFSSLSCRSAMGFCGSFKAFLKPRSASPIAFPTSGSFPGPNRTSTIMKMTSSSGKPTSPSMAILLSGVRGKSRCLLAAPRTVCSCRVRPLP